MSFKEIIGQDAAVSFLKSAYRNRRVASAYLFLGPDGVGKKEAALEFAKLLICTNPGPDEACQKCAACLKVESLAHPDLQWLKPQGQFIKIDAIREACRVLNLKGFESNRKVLIISQAQYLNEEASNALLKTLEEPTQYTVIILIADTIRSILPTIASRCQKIVFSPLPQELLTSLLSKKFSVEPQALSYLARISQGSLGRALEYNQSGLFARKNKIINDALNRSCPLSDFMQWSKDRDGIFEVLCVLSSWFRDLLLAKICKEADFINTDRREDIIEACRRFSFSEIEARILALAETGLEARRNINTRISLAQLRSELWK